MISVSCAVIIQDGKILATQRSENMSQALKWEFPGGKLEAGESAEDALTREIQEELHIKVSIALKLSDSVYHYDNFSIRLIPFICRYISGEIILSEHKAYEWFILEDLSKLEWAPADIPIVQELTSLLSSS